MVGQGSNCDSDWIPGFMQTTAHSTASARNSVSGGIHVEVSDEGYEDRENNLYEDDRAVLERETVNRVASAAFAINKDERNELIDMRLRVQRMQQMLDKNGLSMTEMEKESLEQEAKFNVGSASSLRLFSERDDLGLPNLQTIFNASKVFDGKSERMDTKPVQESIGTPPNSKLENRSWRNVVRDSNPGPTSHQFQFFPPHIDAQKGTPVVKPPKEFLKESQKAWSSSLVGYFLGSNLPFKLVEEEAKKLWLHLGFVKMYMVKKGFYVFKFNTELERNRILAGGPWHFKSNQMFLQPWFEGKKLEKSGFKKLPVWVKIHDIPYSYWTSTGLSYVDSAIGRPLQLDPVTAKLDPMPYEKVLVEVTVEVTLPSIIDIAVLDEDGNTESLIQSKVEYFNKPVHCLNCNVFGHSFLRCPSAANVTSTWSRKIHQPGSFEPHTDKSSGQGNSELPCKGDTSSSTMVTPDKVAETVVGSKTTVTEVIEELSPPIPASGLLAKLKQVDEVVKIKGILKRPTPTTVSIQSGTQAALDPDPDGFQKVESKKSKQKSGLTPKKQPPSS